jgi:hypothetical protein
MQLLVLSNGHGEDAIATRIVKQLRRHPNAPAIAALPIVGTGYAYSQLNIPILGQVKQLPSGGFIYMDGKQLLRDVRGGLLQLSWEQYKVVRRWGKSGGKILAVGDIVPLLFAWLSGSEYAFVGTAKSEYYLRNDEKWLPQTSTIERWLGSVYLPWDCWLMSRPRCKAVFPRDALTAQMLQRRSIRAFDLGNPMMDGLSVTSKQLPVTSLQESINRYGKNTGRLATQRVELVEEFNREQNFRVDRPLSSFKTEMLRNMRSKVEGQKLPLTILLLPGSRMPEAEQNWQTILSAIAAIVPAFRTRPLVFLAAIAPALSLAPFRASLILRGWSAKPRESVALAISDANAAVFTLENSTLVLSRNAYAESLQAADIAIAMAGTATEQFVGLGKPAILIPGKGPQFTYAFAEAQTRLLGCSAILVEEPLAVAGVIQTLLADPDCWHEFGDNGRRRMGTPGAADRIARCLMKQFTQKQ